jgi:exodeoxyribonuclease V alpha subunit
LVEATRADGDNGHTIVPRSELVAAAAELLGLRPAAVDPIVAIAIEKHGLVRRAETDCGEAYQLPSTFRAERNLARAVVDFVRPVSVRQRPSRDQIAQAFPFQPNEQQLLAVERAFTNGLSLILGGPGTGKTATTRAIRMLFKGPTAGLAPTGVAAKRQEVATGYPSGTIHRGLRARPTAGGGFYFVHHAGNPLPLENGALVTDEIGMLDTFLAASLLTAVPHSCNVIGVGDIGQLASVGPGNVLSDLIDVGVPCTELTEIYRTGQGSPIPYIAREIMAGRVPELDATGDARFIETANTEAPSDLLGVVKGMTSGGIAAENIAVMTPTKGGPFGSDVLNQWLQRLWNPGGFDRGCVPNGAVFAGHGGEKQEEVLCIGDRVMQMRNDYELEIYNGDIMTVLDVDNRKKPTVYVRVDDGRELALSGAAALRNVRLAYASTVHKRQGDQVQHAVVALLRQHGRMLHRKLVNTAITRAQYSVTIVGERIALDMAANDYGLQPDKDGAGHAFERRTGLRELITAEFDERQRIA